MVKVIGVLGNAHDARVLLEGLDVPFNTFEDESRDLSCGYQTYADASRDLLYVVVNDTKGDGLNSEAPTYPAVLNNLLDNDDIEVAARLAATHVHSVSRAADHLRTAAFVLFTCDVLIILGSRPVVDLSLLRILQDISRVKRLLLDMEVPADKNGSRRGGRSHRSLSAPYCFFTFVRAEPIGPIARHVRRNQNLLEEWSIELAEGLDSQIRSLLNSCGIEDSLIRFPSSALCVFLVTSGVHKRWWDCGDELLAPLLMLDDPPPATEPLSAGSAVSFTGLAGLINHLSHDFPRRQCWPTSSEKQMLETLLGSPPVQDTIRQCIDVEGLVSLQRCREAGTQALASYQEGLPPYYRRAEHRRRMKQISRSLVTNAMGSALLKGLTLIVQQCDKYWSDGRRACEADSLTGAACALPLHRLPNEQGELPEARHDAGIFEKRACNCGRSQADVAAPFSLKEGNVTMFRRACCRDRSEGPESDAGELVQQLLPIASVEAGFSVLSLGHSRSYDRHRGLAYPGFLPAAQKLVSVDLRVPVLERMKSSSSEPLVPVAVPARPLLQTSYANILRKGQSLDTFTGAAADLSSDDDGTEVGHDNDSTEVGTSPGGGGSEDCHRGEGAAGA
eukprot:Rmarinus@m.23011